MKVVDDNIKINISKNIRFFLESEKKTRKELCKDLDIKYTTFCDWINGKTVPNYNSLEKLGKYFRVEPWVFYGDVEESKKARANALARYALEFEKGKMLEMSMLDTLDDEQIKSLLAAGFRFRHRSLEEIIEETGGPLVSTPEFDWGEPVGREIW